MAKTPAQLEGLTFEIAIRRLADSLTPGTDASPYRGTGVDYVQSRPYVAGDPIKSIDWRVTARTGRTHVKEYESLKHVPMYVVVDCSASMGAKSGALSKWDWAVMLAGALGLAGLDRGNPVALLATGPDNVVDSRQPPTLSRPQWLTRLARLRGRSPDQTDARQIASTLNEIERTAGERGLLLLLSDLHEPGITRSLKRAGESHECVVLRLTDPAEQAVRARGFFRAAEAETGRRFTLVGRRSYRNAQDIEQDLRRGGVELVTLRIDRNFLPELRDFLHRRTLGR